MLNSHYGTSGWSLSVEENLGHKAFDLFFAEVAPRLAAFSPEMRLLANEICRTNAAGIEACNAMRATRMEVLTRLARARGKPTLVYGRGAYARTRARSGELVRSELLTRTAGDLNRLPPR